MDDNINNSNSTPDIHVNNTANNNPSLSSTSADTPKIDGFLSSDEEDEIILEGIGYEYRPSLLRLAASAPGSGLGSGPSSASAVGVSGGGAGVSSKSSEWKRKW